MSASKSAPARPSGRKPDEMRPVVLEVAGVSKYAEGACLAQFGDTHVLCLASVENRVPPWLRNRNMGWVTVEYGMLPRATNDRQRREAVFGKQTGRTQEIQRFIGRSLRAVVDLPALGERQIVIDCDVLQADGSTRTTAITGAWVALYQAVSGLRERGLIKTDIIRDHVAAISCGIYQDQPVLDLDYAEDSMADADGNFVMTGAGGWVEIQSTAEKAVFSDAQFATLLQLAHKGMADLIALQKQAIG